MEKIALSSRIRTQKQILELIKEDLWCLLSPDDVMVISRNTIRRLSKEQLQELDNRKSIIQAWRQL